MLTVARTGLSALGLPCPVLPSWYHQAGATGMQGITCAPLVVDEQTEDSRDP